MTEKKTCGECDYLDLEEPWHEGGDCTHPKVVARREDPLCMKWATACRYFKPKRKKP